VLNTRNNSDNIELEKGQNQNHFLIGRIQCYEVDGGFGGVIDALCVLFLHLGFGVSFLVTLGLTLFFDWVVRIKTGKVADKIGEKGWFEDYFIRRLQQVVLLAVIQFILSINFLTLFGILYEIQYPNIMIITQYHPEDYLASIYMMLYANGAVLAFFDVNSAWGLYILYKDLKPLRKF